MEMIRSLLNQTNAPPTVVTNTPHGDDPEAMGTLGEITVKKAVGRENVSGAIAGTAEAGVSSKTHVRRGKFKMVVATRVGATG